MRYLTYEEERQNALESERMSDGEFMSEVFYQHARAEGEEDQDSKWVLTPYDVWVSNPFWNGANPDQPHPEEY